MCVFKYHAFIYFLRPPPWYGTRIIKINQSINIRSFPYMYFIVLGYFWTHVQYLWAIFGFYICELFLAYVFASHSWLTVRVCELFLIYVHILDLNIRELFLTTDLWAILYLCICKLFMNVSICEIFLTYFSWNIIEHTIGLFELLMTCELTVFLSYSLTSVF